MDNLKGQSSEAGTHQRRVGQPVLCGLGRTAAVNEGQERVLIIKQEHIEKRQPRESAQTQQQKQSLP